MEAARIPLQALLWAALCGAAAPGGGGGGGAVGVWKCCLRGEQLHRNGRDCEARPGAREEPLLRDLFWLPPHLAQRDLSVRYTEVFHCNKFRVLSSNDTARLSFADDMNVTLRSLDPSGRPIETVIEPAEYCFDASDGPLGPWVIRICTFEVLPQIDKCCPQGEFIEEKLDGLPKCVENHNLTQHESEEVRKMNTAPDFTFDSYSLCNIGTFRVFRHPNVTRGFALRFLEGRTLSADGASWRYMCLDAERGAGGGGGLRWALGYCAFRPPRLQALSAAAFLPAPAAALLAAALAAQAARPSARASLHGRALACHAAALLAAHAAAAAHAFGGGRRCRLLAIIINFFLLAAAFWLQIMCFNMARGFSQMLRASNPAIRKTSRTKIFCLYSLYGWGCPSIATIVIVCNLSDYEFSGPLYHTKTCFYEEGPFSRTRKISTFFYYYGPICIILVSNIAMFVFTALKIRMMRRDTSILNRKEDGRPSGTRKSAVLYVKLLLLTGVLEAACDLAAWACKDSAVRAAGGVRVADAAFVYSEFLRRELLYRCAAHALDLLRAAAVFALCCCGESVRRRARAAAVSCLQCGPAPRCNPWRCGRPARLLRWLVRRLRRRVGPLEGAAPRPPCAAPRPEGRSGRASSGLAPPSAGGRDTELTECGSPAAQEALGQ